MNDAMNHAERSLPHDSLEPRVLRYLGVLNDKEVTRNFEGYRISGHEVVYALKNQVEELSGFRAGNHGSSREAGKQ